MNSHRFHSLCARGSPPNPSVFYGTLWSPHWASHACLASPWRQPAAVRITETQTHYRSHGKELNIKQNQFSSAKVSSIYPFIKKDHNHTAHISSMHCFYTDLGVILLTDFFCSFKALLSFSKDSNWALRASSLSLASSMRTWTWGQGNRFFFFIKTHSNPRLSWG